MSQEDNLIASLMQPDACLRTGGEKDELEWEAYEITKVISLRACLDTISPEVFND